MMTSTERIKATIAGQPTDRIGVSGWVHMPLVDQKMMQYSKNELHAGLEAITETCCRFAEELVKIGVDGIFYATQFGSSDLITDEQHEEFGRPYDLRVLDVLKDRTWFNIMHIHGHNNLSIEKYIDYPVQALNWEHCGDTEESSTSFASIRAMTDKVLIGGVNQLKDLYTPSNDREAVKEILRKRYHECMIDNKCIFAPGCGFELDINTYLFILMKEVVEEEAAR